MKPETLTIQPRSGLHYNKLRAPVRSYVDNLRAQVYEVLQKYDVTNMTEFIAKIHHVKPKDYQQVIKLMGAIEMAYHKNESPEFIAEFEAIREQQAQELEKFFGQQIDVPKLPEGITHELLEFWKENGFAMKFLPKIKMEEKEDFPGWLHKPGKKFTPNKNWGVEFYNDLQKIQNLPENQSNPHLKDLTPIDLPGAWVLADTRAKPNYESGNQSYENDNLIQETLKKLPKGILNTEASAGLRNKIHPSVFNKPEFWQALAQALKVDIISGATVRLPRTIEANVMGQGKGFHDTNTFEWCEEYYQSGTRLICGDSDHGGASNVSRYDVASGRVGLRPLVVFS